MPSKCANPDCSNPFDYRQGRMFRFWWKRGAASHKRQVQHYWLCDTCAHTFTLEHIQGKGIKIQPRRLSPGARPPQVISAA